MKKRSYLSVIIAFLFVFSTFTSVFASPIESMDKNTLLSTAKEKKIVHSTLKADPRVAGLKDSDKVRIIVELEDKPVIEYATAQGVEVTDMNQDVLTKVTENLVHIQTEIKNNLAAMDFDLEYHESFYNVVNGFSATTTLETAKQIEKIKGVHRVVIANEYLRPDPINPYPNKPDMNTSKDMISTKETWGLNGFKGEGMVVSIIDTGIDVSHKDMVLSDPNKASLKETDISSLITLNQLPGKFYTTKVPYGYNYADKNNEIRDIGPEATMHGMHVGGTVAANGDENNGGISGVAPEAQLLAMKIFGNENSIGSTGADLIIKAIDDSVKLRADVINMSLGSTANFVMPDDPEQLAIKRATENGVFLAVSAGNSGHIGFGWSSPITGEEKPYFWNPDIGVVGSPGLANDALQVASAENTNITNILVEFAGSNEYDTYLVSGHYDPIDVFNKQTIAFEFVGFGLQESPTGLPPIDDYANKDLRGKIALIERGGPTGYDISFTTKIMNAQNHGAAGVIIFNNERVDKEVLVSMQYPLEGTIPAISVARSTGLKLTALSVKKVTFLGNISTINNPDAGKMSDFSSWGVTPNLDFKPEITAPGGQIYSTLNDDKYGTMSGTSMAAPHVAGGAALILQRLKNEFPSLTGKAKVEMVKNLFMSTAHPLMRKDGFIYSNFGESYPASPRKQGAGVMDLYGAATTPTIVTDSNTGISKVDLKEIGKSTTFPITITNYSNQTVAYNVYGFVGTDLIVGGLNQLEMIEVVDRDTFEYPIYFTYEDGSSVTDTVYVQPNSELNLNVTLELFTAMERMYGASLDDIRFYENGTFIEGFIKFEPVNASIPTIGIPYMGFYGNWDQAPIIEEPLLNPGALPYYGYTILSWLNEAEDLFMFLGIGPGEMPIADHEYVSFSPNGDGLYDNVHPLLSMMRNAKEVEVSITKKEDSQLKIVRTLSKDTNVRKSYFDSGRGIPLITDDSWAWDGKDEENRVVADGQYYYLIKSKIDYPDADWQSTILPVKVDTKAPVISKINYDEATKTLTVEANDGSLPVYSYVLTEQNSNLIEQENGVFNLSSLSNGEHTLKVRVNDFAHNITFSNDVKLVIGGGPVTPPGPTPGPVTPPGPTPSPVTPPVNNTPPSQELEVGTISTNKNTDGSQSATVSLASEGVTKQLTGVGTTVAINLSDANISNYKDVAITLDKPTSDKLIKSGKMLTLTNSEIAIEIPAEALADFIDSNGFKIIISVNSAGNKGTVQIQSIDKTAIVSSVVTIGTTSGKLTKPINIILKPNQKSVGDLRKVGVYYKEESGTWTYVGSNSIRNGNNIVLTTSQLGSFAAIENSYTFSDIDKHWAKDQIEVISSHHITKGKSETRFAPNDMITHAEFAALLDRFMGKKKAWSEYAKMADATKLLNREEMVVMLVNALNIDLSEEKTEISFKDKELISIDAQRAIAYAYNKGLVLGVSESEFNAKGTSSRAQVSVLLYRLMKHLGKI